MTRYTAALETTCLTAAMAPTIDTLNGNAGDDTIHAGVSATGTSNDMIDGGEGPMAEENDPATDVDVRRRWTSVLIP